MILVAIDLRLQVLTCQVCGEHLEIPRHLLNDQQALLELHQETKRDHRECAAANGNLEKAMRDRAFRKRVEREERKLAKPAGNALPRCRNRRLGRLPG